MRIQLDFEIPNWTRWVVAGLLVGLALGYGIATVRADALSVKTWSKGEILTADALNQNFLNLQTAINAQQTQVNSFASPDCPSGYTLSAATTGIVLCKKGADEVVKVGSGSAAFWIDRYEASIWSGAGGIGTEYGLLNASEFPSGFPANGQYSTPLYALSIPLVQPSAYVSWFQADAACEASGKRLPTRVQWLRAARGTPDPGQSEGANFVCLTKSEAVRNTGGGSRCASMWGAQDMIGNLWEFAEEWYASPRTETNPDTVVVWPKEILSGDTVYGLASQSYDTGWYTGIPGAGIHGGSMLEGTEAGVLTLHVGNSPYSQNKNVGFRCAIAR